MGGTKRAGLNLETLVGNIRQDEAPRRAVYWSANDNCGMMRAEQFAEVSFNFEGERAKRQCLKPQRGGVATRSKR